MIKSSFSLLSLARFYREKTVFNSYKYIRVVLSNFRGARYPTGVIVPTSRLHESFQGLFPNSHIFANPGGSTTSEIFSEMMMRCLAVPAREVIPKEQPVVVILDSGGGSFLHLSPKLLKVALDFNLRPFYLLDNQGADAIGPGDA